MQQPVPVTTNPHRYKQLDSLRGLAALFVFFGHFLGMQANSSLYSNYLVTPLGILFNGNASVILFFVLSGFVLSLPFVNGNKPLKLSTFYIKRIFRIYPAFIVAILLALLLKYYVFDKTGMAPFSVWIRSFWMWEWSHQTLTEVLKTLLLAGPKFDTHLIDPPIWSLVIEMKMSIVLPVLILIVSRNSVGLNIALLFILALLTYQRDSWELSIFYMGVLLARYHLYFVGVVSKWSATIIVVSLLFVVVLFNNNYEFAGYFEGLSLANKYIASNYLIAVSSCIIMVIILARKSLTNIFEQSIFIFLGNISYGFYLIHLPLIIVFGSVFSNRFTWSPAYIFTSTLIASIVIAYVLFIWIEKPFQKLAVWLISKYPVLDSFNIKTIK